MSIIIFVGAYFISQTAQTPTVSCPSFGLAAPWGYSDGEHPRFQSPRKVYYAVWGFTDKAQLPLLKLHLDEAEGHVDATIVVSTHASIGIEAEAFASETCVFHRRTTSLDSTHCRTRVHPTWTGTSS